MAESPKNQNTDTSRLEGLETEVRELRNELRRAHVSLWRLVVAIVVVIGLRDFLGREKLWQIVSELMIFVIPVVGIVL